MAFHPYHSSSFPRRRPDIARSAQRGNYCHEASFIGTDPALFPKRAGLASFRTIAAQQRAVDFLGNSH
jgi:hypothetical protein